MLKVKIIARARIILILNGIKRYKIITVHPKNKQKYFRKASDDANFSLTEELETYLEISKLSSKKNSQV